MLKLEKIFLIVIGLIFTIPGWSQLSDYKFNTTKFKLLIEKSKIPKEDLSLFISTKSQKQMISHFSISENKLMNPASVTKLFAAGALLDHFGPGFTFLTEVKTSAKETTGVLYGDLFIKGQPDPSITGSSLWTMMQKIKRIGITEIKGDLVLDESFLKTTKDVHISFGRTLQPALSAFSFSENVFVLMLVANEKEKTAQIAFDFNSDYFIVENSVSVSSTQGPTKIDVQRMSTLDNTKEKIVLKGILNPNGPPFRAEFQVLNPTFWFGFAIAELFKQSGIKWVGSIKKGTAPKSNLRLLTFHKSPAIEDLISKMMKESRNFYAELLATSLSGLEMGNPELGILRIKNFISQLGIDSSSILIDSPAGLSRQNRVTTKNIVHFLQAMLNKPYSTEFVRAFSINGVDGTLRGRMQEIHVKNYIRAKTGQLNGVVSIAGYVWNPDNGFIPFAFIYNGQKQEQNARELFDQMLIELASP